MFNNSNNNNNNRNTSDSNIRSIDSLLEPLEILGATNDSGQLMFLIRWRGTNRADLVAANVANIKWPQMVIKYYEQRVIFHPPE
ncbi:chromobox protein homolog 5 [Drosophila serrata]|uniref:chromobox protein homolog 5 n=1 Tax=Drosophila serrata TaxID=7274 RepID=UPI000A1D2070|nr:chromobox protein homolog 5 [Drosophila serrata]